jgi:hypothetical protein
MVHPDRLVLPARRELQRVLRVRDWNLSLEEPLILQNVGPLFLFHLVPDAVANSPSTTT